MIKELFITLAFLILYLPLSFFTWYETNGNLVDLFIYILGAELIILVYLILALVSLVNKKPKRPLPKVEFENEVKEIENNLEESSDDDFVAFRTLFSQNKQFGGGYS